LSTFPDDLLVPSSGIQQSQKSVDLTQAVAEVRNHANNAKYLPDFVCITLLIVV